jgi:sporulation protein YlmC with PRC-barrel domain
VLAVSIDIQPRLSTYEGGAAVLAAENVHGYDVRGIDNVRLGRVDDLVVDEATGRVRFLKVGDGGILGIGRTHRLVPVDVVKGVSGEFVFMDASKSQFELAPTWRPLVDPSYIPDVLRYFGTRAFWDAGYTSPDWTSPD